MNVLKTIYLLSRYNLKIIFGGKYLVFVIISLLLFIYFMFNSAYYGNELNETAVYSNILLPALLLIFYPTVYGLQKDEESKILEILFCIPNYMYKVWLVRLLFVFVGTFFITLFFSYVAHLLLCPVEIIKMSSQVMFIVFFFGSLAFFLSTAVKSGNGTAVVLVFLYAVIAIIGQAFENSMWNVLINPFKESTYIHPDVWQQVITNNRLFLVVASFGFLLMALNNLQRREKLL